MTLNARTADRHVLYEEAVQCVEADLDFFSKVFKKTRGYAPHTLREDFCGTASLACEWVARHEENRAWGVDLDRPTLDWGIKHHLSRLGDDQDRVTLIEGDVLASPSPAVQVTAALNFSYQVFKDRKTLLAYFKNAYSGLADDGMFFLDAFGGTESMEENDEDRRISPATRPDGSRLPAYTYIWEQASFNPIDHNIVCHIHFKFKDGSKLKKAFTYDWRLWTLPELQELILEAGFSRADVYMEGWDDDEDEADGIFKKKTRAENMAGWVGYVVGIK
ncbi:MAG: class I SAM-dependent methyltransferase [Candidatus Eisenbacteria bacterium]|uniref:Class I SAM-dependent methyltransferase n=1 Tax=Eiseniibacteriota bacterium TaxID=2212470 RepID=A0A7Y2E7V3_UNCEI|nr:class I SAM-dependent methyltransferase [Candidatus Eisenbacteria bacterium]